MSSEAKLTFVLGGARSGKSRYAESVVSALPPPWFYLATATAGDDEMAARIAAHRARRSPPWHTIEAPRDLTGGLAARGHAPALVDCLTLWLSNLMMAEASIEEEFATLRMALRDAAGPVVLVANEVGLGIVPESALGRAFRDQAGRLNQRVAAAAARVVFVAAGLPMLLKDTVPAELR